MKIESDESLHSLYLGTFSEKTATVAATYSDHFNTITTNLAKAFSIKVATVLLFSGPFGSGRKKFIQRLCRAKDTEGELIIERSVTVDCALYSTEARVWSKIYDKLLDMDPQLEEDGSAPSQHARQLFESKLKSTRTLVYLENLDVFTGTRQQFLYSLLENLAVSEAQICLIFGTTDLFFLNKLEKRIKSRFNFTSYIFSLEIQTPFDFLEKFLDCYPQLPRIQTFRAWLRVPACKAIFESLRGGIFELGAVLRLVKSAIAESDPESFARQIRKETGSASPQPEEFLSALRSAKSRLFGQYSVDLVEDLPLYHRVVLKAAADKFQPNEGKFSLNYEDLKVHLLSASPKFSFYNELLVQIIEELAARSFIGVGDKVISAKTKICLKVPQDAIEVLKQSKIFTTKG